MNKYICMESKKVRCTNNLNNEFVIEIGNYKKIKLLCGCTKKIKILSMSEFEEFITNILNEEKFQISIFNYYQDKIHELEDLKQSKYAKIIKNDFFDDIFTLSKP